jgi:pimeloyl-ACP methyl ester carboxylesterase
MARVPDLPVQHFRAHDGTELAYRETGAGRPLVLIHGFVSTGYVNWVKPGHAALLAEAGYRVVMPDLRGHGASARPHDPAAYPPDVLTDDGFALLEHLGLTDGAAFDLGGYSLGGRTVVRMMVRGCAPARAVVAGMGLDNITSTGSSTEWFRHVLSHYGTFRHGDPEFMAQAFVKTVDGDPEALLRVIESSVDTPVEQIGAVQVPTLVLMGDQDDDHGSADALAATLPNATSRAVPGSHMGAVAQPELGRAIADWLGPADAGG